MKQILTQKRAEMGISSLILFLAMIFVATVAANVLIQTSTSLQSKALEVGKQAQAQVSTHIGVLAIFSDDGRDNALENAYIQTRLSPGSDVVKINDTVVSVFTSNTKADLVYKSGPCDNSTGGFSTDANGKGFFTIEYFKNATDHRAGYIMPGEVVKICFKLPEIVGEDREIKFSIIPKVGIPTTTTILTPSSIVTKNTFLYP